MVGQVHSKIVDYFNQVKETHKTDKLALENNI